MLRSLRAKVDAVREIEQVIEEDDEDTLPLISLSDQQIADAWTVDVDDDVFVVRGEKIEKFARRTNFDGFENVNRLRDIMKKLGISHELSRKGATGESIIRIGDNEFPLLEQ